MSGSVGRSFVARGAPFGAFQEQLDSSVAAWRLALTRPDRDVVRVEAGLLAALSRRGLGWKLRRFDNLSEARAAWISRGAYVAWVGGVIGAGVAWLEQAGAYALAIRNTWEVGDMHSALMVEYASLMGWISIPADYLTVGIRKAYSAGLAAAVPVGVDTLGWILAD